MLSFRLLFYFYIVFSFVTGLKSQRSDGWRMGSQWSQIKSQNQIIIKNNYSQQQFLLHSIPNNEKNNIKLYFVRQFSCLPQTPKIICLQKQQTHIIVLVEKSHKFFSQWLREINCQLAVLQKLNDVLHGIDTLKRKFGGFIITQKMVQLSVNKNVMVWYNEKFHSNFVQLPLSKVKANNQDLDNQSVMVRNVVEIFKKNVYFSQKIATSFLGINTFKELRNIVKRRIHQIQRVTIPEKQIRSSIQEIDMIQQPSSQRYKSNHKRNSSVFSQKKRTKTYVNTDITSRHSSNVPKAKIQKNFLLEETQKLQQNDFIQQYNSQNQQRKSFFKQNQFQILDKKQPTSSQRYSSSNMSSKQYIKESLLLKKDNFRPWNSFHHIQFIKDSMKEPNMFKRKQCGYKNLTIYQVNQKQQVKDTLQNQAPNKQNCHVHFSPTFKSISPTHSYKPFQSFSSTKQFSLKSTTGTLKKTREFNDQAFRQLIVSQRETIKQQSDETYKNSNNYSVQTIKQQQKEQQKCSVTVSDDFNQLFSGRSSNQCNNQETQIRQMEFERVLWGDQ